MELELAAVEEDVQRKRVGKNPFDQKFTALTESPFTETSANGGLEMDTISRHIIARMEVIGKQIAFLSKETEGQPHSVLAIGKNDSSKSASEQQCQWNAFEEITTTLDDGDDIESRSRGKEESATARNRDTSFGTSIAARVELFRRIRRGIVSANELVPENMLLTSRAGSSTSFGSASRGHVLAPAGGIASGDGGGEGASGTSRWYCDDDDGEYRVRCARSGVLHDFIKHVKPFSVCFETAAVPRSPSAGRGPERMKMGFANVSGPSVLAAAENAAESSAPAAASASASIATPSSRHDIDNNDIYGAATATVCDSDGCEMPSDFSDNMPTIPSNIPIPSPPNSVSPRFRVVSTSRSITQPDQMKSSSGDKPSKHNQQVVHCKSAVHPASGGSETLDRAEVSVQGKRKLEQVSSSSPSLPSSNSSKNFALAARPRRGDEGDGNDGDYEDDQEDRYGGGQQGRGRTSPSTKENRAWTQGEATAPFLGEKISRRSNNNISGRQGVGRAGQNKCFMSISWASARQLRTRMEGAVSLRKPSTRADFNSKKGGGNGGRKRRPIKITLRDSSSAAAGSGTIHPATAIGSLGLLRSNTHLPFFQEVDGLSNYLTSFANPYRDLAAMKKAFQDKQPRLSSPDALQTVHSPMSRGLPKVMGTSASPPLPFEESSPASDIFSIEVGPSNQHEVAAATNGCDGGPHHPGDVGEDESATVATSTQEFSSSVDCRLSVPPMAQARVDDTDGTTTGGTYVIDLRSTWQRTGVVRQAVSKASLKQTRLAQDLRRSFERLVCQNHEKMKQHQQDVTKLHNKGDGHCKVGSAADREYTGQARSIGVETTMSVSLRHSLQKPESTPLAVMEEEPASGVGRGGVVTARLFALVVSLAHSHNVSSKSGSGSSHHGSGGSSHGAGKSSSQLHVHLADGGREAVVTARRN